LSSVPSSLREARSLISAMRAKAFARHAVIPEPPEEPLPENCCERGCDRCVFTVYYEVVDEWRRDVEAAIKSGC
jgi:hypothetical protein